MRLSICLRTVTLTRIGVLFCIYTPTEWQGSQLNTSPLSVLLIYPVGRLCIQFIDDKACYLTFNHTDPMAELSKTERDGIVKANAGNRRVVDITNEHNAALKPEYAEAFFLLFKKMARYW